MELYDDRADECLEQIVKLVEHHRPYLPTATGQRWNERDVVLITYGDQLLAPDQSPLQTLREFLIENELGGLVSTIHLLPFFPYSSDDGFSVSDYRRVDSSIGGWEDIRALGQDWNLMFDLVLNHVSRRHRWFRDYVAGVSPYVHYFIETEQESDLAAVARPRSSPLLTAIGTNRGTRHLWTTFSADQIDLNYAEPAVLVEMIDLLLFYIGQGARVIRLDAVAYLWKQPGTRCIHLPKTHCIVKILRDVLDELASDAILVTETNVPHQENISYFGDGDEAHMVYQFSLPPLLLDAFLNHDGRPLKRWLTELEPTRPGTTYLNFTASHDGIGVRPLEGLVSRERMEHLVDAVGARGGLISNRCEPDGSLSPYELNITYLDALNEPDGLDTRLHARRFLASQSVMLALRGIPGVYYHSLVGTLSDYAGVEDTGQARRINRRKFRVAELTETLADTTSVQSRVWSGYRHLLATRRDQPAFHPDAEQQICDIENPSIIGFVRTSLDQRQQILVLVNLSDCPQQLELEAYGGRRWNRDLLSNQTIMSVRHIELSPYQVAWLEAVTV